MDGNLAPNAGAEWFDAPEEQVEEERVEASIRATSYPILSEVADWFEEQIQYLGDQDLIDIEHSILSAESQILGYRYARQLMRAKYDEFKEFQEKV